MQDSTKATPIIAKALVALLLTATCLFAAGCAAEGDPASSQGAQSSQGSQTEAADAISASILVDSSSVADEGYPENLASETLTLEKGASVFDALKATGLAIVDSDAYVTSIDGLSTGQFGSDSGWLYLVDGKIPEVGCDEYILQGGEEITWLYSLNTLEDYEKLS